MCGLVFVKEKIKQELFIKCLEKINHRGPDDTESIILESASFGFKRLAIMDLSHKGDQPFIHQKIYSLCNGEIYNQLSLRDKYDSYEFSSLSDCEVLVPAFLEGGIKGLVEELDGEYAFVIYDENKDRVYAARDEMGIRPLFYGRTKKGEMAFASEVKALTGLCTKVLPFPPGHYFDGDKIIKFHDYKEVKCDPSISFDMALKGIKKKLVSGVQKRLNSDAPIGFLLSGGLDSSLVCSIAQKYSDKPIKTFGIGMSEDAIDLKYAKEVADFIGSDHTEVIISRADVIEALREVIYHLESWDITTIRASVGMYLICKFIRENTDIKVLMTGEVSDEIFGYKYTDFAPSPTEFQKEAQKRVDELYIYDVLRADRCISAHGLEARVPFSDREFVEFVMSIDPGIKMNKYGQGKFLLRKSFEGDFLPDSILYREKAAFSDAVGHSLVDCLKEYAQELYSQKEYEKGILKYEYNTPFTKESLLYRDIFNEFYPKKCKLIKDFWMPNKEWKNCDVTDPSARVLPNYGESGV